MNSTSGNWNNKAVLGKNITVARQAEGCTIYKVQDETGEGTMTCYGLFPGIDIIFNDFHMQACFSEFRPKVDMIGIDHCREGRIEGKYRNSYLYMQRGDLQINAKEHHICGFELPLSHYHGATVAIYVEEAEAALTWVFDGFPVDLRVLREKFCTGRTPFILRDEEHVAHIFGDIYSAPEGVKTDYLRLKVLELLLFLQNMDARAAAEKPTYFPKKQVGTVKEIMKYITGNIDRRITQQELSRKFSIPLTSMKLCFKGVYGMSIYDFIRSYRMQAAALMLRESEDNIAVIAGRVGYDNASKFASAFKTETGRSPGEYRKTVV
jgi:AraC-like DNA-binding protein